ncbi:MAG: tetratricopeptide repeat protein [Alphaproteobacteria bacterium]|nr:tetratricopeptide repeat protein [Alphaproteobacteria bacterium]MDP6621140.1 tetratricopeptide repeat protein [Alphaproteobacteria bacterium]
MPRFLAALCALLLVAAAPPALACGWGGENEGDDDDEAIVIGADGKPVVEAAADPAALTDLGNLQRGNSELAAAVRSYRQAAEQGHAPAQNNLATMYEQGLGLPRDDAQAVVWFRRAAEAGFAPAQHSLAMMLREGRGAERDAGQAARWLRRAAAGGHHAAFVDLGALYWAGEGVAKDPVEALACWTVAGEAGAAAAAEPRRRALAALTRAQISAAKERARVLRTTE